MEFRQWLNEGEEVIRPVRGWARPWGTGVHFPMPVGSENPFYYGLKTFAANVGQANKELWQSAFDKTGANTPAIFHHEYNPQHVQEPLRTFRVFVEFNEKVKGETMTLHAIAIAEKTEEIQKFIAQNKIDKRLTKCKKIGQNSEGNLYMVNFYAPTKGYEPFKTPEAELPDEEEEEDYEP